MNVHKPKPHSSVLTRSTPLPLGRFSVSPALEPPRWTLLCLTCWSYEVAVYSKARPFRLLSSHQGQVLSWYPFLLRDLVTVAAPDLDETLRRPNVSLVLPGVPGGAGSLP